MASKCWRLPGFDYSRPYYYMVTLKRLEGLLPLSAIVAPGRCEMSAITKAFVHVIRVFHERVAGLCPIECFTVMPDHLHLLIKIAGQMMGIPLADHIIITDKSHYSFADNGRLCEKSRG